MEFTHLDKQFDESIERLEKKAPLAKNPYGALPLASDHFLLRKSWDYFKSRVKTIEDQWRKMLQAKEIQMTALRDELLVSRARAAELEDENQMIRSLDQNVKKARAEDYVGFARKHEHLKMRWESEREALQRKIDDLEFRVARSKKEGEKDRLAAKGREDVFKDTLLALQKEASQQADRERDVQRRWTEHVNEQQEKILALETRVEILRSEVERRDILIKQLKETAAGQERDSQTLTQYVAELQRVIREKDTEFGHLKTRFDILRQEKDNMKASWEREQAEWRELWDRGRESWERRK